jgi:hypothetical protein
VAKAEMSQETVEMSHHDEAYHHPEMHHHDEMTILLGVICGVILGFLLKLFSDYLNERSRFKRNFLEIKHCIHYMSDAAGINLELRRLKSFFTGHFELLEKPDNNHFFQKWLMNIDGHQWDKKEVTEEMLTDLDKLKV